MHLNHLNLVVTNVAAAVSFFKAYFGFTCTEIKGDNVIAVLKNKDHFTLVLMTQKDDDAIYPDAFHIGFMQENEAQVMAVYERLKAGNITVGTAPKKIRDSFGFYFTFDSVMIEVGCYLN